MDTIIIYASRYGYTKDCVELLKEQLVGNVEIVDISSLDKIDLSKYEQVLLGGSIKIGQLQNAIIQFALLNKKELLTKKLGLFISCGEANKYMTYLKSGIPNELVTHASSIECFGGEFRKENMKFLEKRMISIMEKSNKQKGERPPTILFENIKKMADLFNV